MIKSKIFAAYLPQFHKTPENDKFWGEGFSDWCGVKNARPLFEGQKQPRVPLGNNYYDLTDIHVLEWQSSIAKKYGISGFNIYHYWFKDNHKVLYKPAELLLNNQEIDIEFFFTWDNTSWVRSWSNIKGNSWSPLYDQRKNLNLNEVLLELSYGNEIDWKCHFQYLVDFFKDKRYLKIDNKPVFSMMNCNDRNKIRQMLSFWNGLAIEYGFNGMYYIFAKKTLQNNNFGEGYFIYQPRSSGWAVKDALLRVVNKYLAIDIAKSKSVKYLVEYSHLWKKILRLSRKIARDNSIFCGFVRYDDTPRRGKNAAVVYNESPQLFYKYFGEMYKLSCENNKPFILLTAWNEWGEGAYLEPDEDDKDDYLEVIKKIKEEVI